MDTLKVPELTDEIKALMPAERDGMQEQKSGGILVTFFIAADTAIGWIFFDCASPENTQDLAKGLPLDPYLKVDSTLLAN